MKFVSLESLGDQFPEPVAQERPFPELLEALRSVVYESTGVLTTRERCAIILRIYESRSLRDASHVMHCDQKTVATYVKRGIAKLTCYFKTKKP